MIIALKTTEHNTEKSNTILKGHSLSLKHFFSFRITIFIEILNIRFRIRTMTTKHKEIQTLWI